MLRNSIVAGAATILLGAGMLAFADAPASAGYVHGGWSYGWYYGPRRPPPPPYFGPRRPPPPVQRQVCAPRYKVVRYWKPGRGWVVQRVRAGRVCYYRPAYPRW
ncbi:MAG: hypothetical protein KDJ88_01055 [Bauldia sp.]|nr:hypothetical protein [Bauldia sp.]